MLLYGWNALSDPWTAPMNNNRQSSGQFYSEDTIMPLWYEYMYGEPQK